LGTRHDQFFRLPAVCVSIPIHANIMMEHHAYALLEAAELWDWPATTRIQDTGQQTTCSKFKAITPKLLSGFITESQALGGTLLGRFWDVLETCHPKLKENSRSKCFSLFVCDEFFFAVETLKVTPGPFSSNLSFCVSCLTACS
jgi:hypothetical protein